LEKNFLRIAMISIHSSPIGDLGTRDNGGMSVCVRELARELGRRGHRVDIFTRASGPSDKESVVLADNVRLVYLKVPKSYRASKYGLYPHLPDFFRRLEEFRLCTGAEYDLVHSHYWLSGYLGTTAQACWRVPHITTFHTLGLLKNIIGNGTHEPELRIAAEKMVAQACSRIVVGSRREQHNLSRYYHVPKSKIGIAPCGVDLQLFRPLDRAYARRRLGLGIREKIVLYVGRFDPLKGISRVVEAVGLLKDMPVRFVIAGGDGQANSEMRKLRELARGLCLDGAVRFAGRVEQQELPLYYSAADVLAVPSLYESFGIVALEALACGTPVIATPVGAMDSIISNGINGRIITGATPAAFARAIQSLIMEGPAPEAVRASVSGYGWASAADSIGAEYHTAITGFAKAERCA
jgi:D-inositol-3-phosphate glycosyltransferase